MSISIEESIQRLKAEIIAQDWRLSPNRTQQLEAALACLKNRYKTRKATHAMLMMAASVLTHIKKHGAKPPETIDFIKEAMAHVVGLHEDLTFVPEKEDKIFKGLYKRFTLLKKKINSSQIRTQPPQPGPPPAEPDKNATPLTAQPDRALPETPQKAPEAPSQENQKENLSITPQEQVNPGNATQLIHDLKNSLEKAGEVGTTIGQLLQALLATQTPPSSKEAAPKAVPQEDIPEKVAPPTPKEIITPEQRIKNCPATQLKIMKVNGTCIAIEQESISIIRPIQPNKSKSYIKESNVPLKDFGGFMRGLSSQFSGKLAKIKNSKLKQLNLPIMAPQGLAFSDVQDDEATSLVVISKGSWHGVLACSDVQTDPGVMVKFEQHKNGDIAGCGHLEDMNQVPLLDSLSILKREGFLLTV